MKHIKQLRPLDCKTDQLDFIYTENGYAKLRPQIIDQFKDTKCRLEYIIRVNDNSIRTSSHFELDALKPQIKLEYDYFEVSCKIASTGQSSTKIYASVSRNEQLVNKLKVKSSKNEFNLNVLFYGFDSLSRVHFQRKLPKTYDLLVKKFNITTLQLYNIGM